MSHYSVVQLTMTDPSWLAEYVPAVTAMVHKHGGKYLARTPNLEKIEGDGPAPDVVVLLEFPSKEATLAFYNDPEYQPFLMQRMAGSTGELISFPGEDTAAGT